MENQINFLLDTNIWLERLLKQEQSDSVEELLDTIPSQSIFISDFSLHSIDVIMTRLKRYELYERFINDLFFSGNVSCLSLNPLESLDILEIIQSTHLDFDDGYQTVLSRKFKIPIITFDKDFKKSGIAVLSPEEAVKKYKELTIQ